MRVSSPATFSHASIRVSAMSDLFAERVSLARVSGPEGVQHRKAPGLCGGDGGRGERRIGGNAQEEDQGAHGQSPRRVRGPGNGAMVVPVGVGRGAGSGAGGAGWWSMVWGGRGAWPG